MSTTVAYRLDGATPQKAKWGAVDRGAIAMGKKAVLWLSAWSGGTIVELTERGLKAHEQRGRRRKNGAQDREFIKMCPCKTAHILLSDVKRRPPAWRQTIFSRAQYGIVDAFFCHTSAI